MSNSTLVGLSNTGRAMMAAVKDDGVISSETETNRIVAGFRKDLAEVMAGGESPDTKSTLNERLDAATDYFDDAPYSDDVHSVGMWLLKHALFPLEVTLRDRIKGGMKEAVAGAKLELETRAAFTLGND